MTSCTGAGLGATEDEAVEADGGLEATRLIGDLALPPKKGIMNVSIDSGWGPGIEPGSAG